MAADIVERLRACGYTLQDADLKEAAADEIESLRAANARLSEALGRLADIAYTVAYDRNVGTMDDAIEQARTALTTPSTGKG